MAKRNGVRAKANDGRKRKQGAAPTGGRTPLPAGIRPARSRRDGVSLQPIAGAALTPAQIGLLRGPTINEIMPRALLGVSRAH